jgi:hypothetical protein
MKKYRDFEKGGFVSVWVGSGLTADELDDYLNLSRKFELDFGFELDDRNMPETSVEAKPTTIGSLLQGFSWADRYKDAVISEAHHQTVTQASIMMVFFNFRYEPCASCPESLAPLRFLCAVPF